MKTGTIIQSTIITFFSLSFSCSQIISHKCCWYVLLYHNFVFLTTTLLKGDLYTQYRAIWFPSLLLNWLQLQVIAHFLDFLLLHNLFIYFFSKVKGHLLFSSSLIEWMMVQMQSTPFMYFGSIDRKSLYYISPNRHNIFTEVKPIYHAMGRRYNWFSSSL